MGRTYAGILGLIGFLTIITRSLLQRDDPSGSIGPACLALFAFAAIGAIVGTLAERIVEESVRTKANQELEALEQEAALPNTRAT